MMGIMNHLETTYIGFIYMMEIFQHPCNMPNP